MFPFQETWTFVDFFLECLFKPQKKWRSPTQLISVDPCGSLRGVLDTHKWWWNQCHRLEAYWDVCVKNVQGKMCLKPPKKTRTKTDSTYFAKGDQEIFGWLVLKSTKNDVPDFGCRFTFLSKVGSLLVSHLVNWGYALELADAGVLMETRGVEKGQHWRGNGIFHQISRDNFVIGHGPIWTINLVGIVGWFSRSLCWDFWETTIYHSEVCIHSKSNPFQLCTLTNW